jgi:hypothetical protein
MAMDPKAVQLSEEIGTLFGSVALWQCANKKFRYIVLRRGPVGPEFDSVEQALQYAANKGWNIQLTKQSEVA